MKLTIEVLRSQFFPTKLALAVDGYRVVGPNAGPWFVDASFKLASTELRRVVRICEAAEARIATRPAKKGRKP